jgi:hypothetical protein
MKLPTAQPPRACPPGIHACSRLRGRLAQGRHFRRERQGPPPIFHFSRRISLCSQGLAPTCGQVSHPQIASLPRVLSRPVRLNGLHYGRDGEKGNKKKRFPHFRHVRISRPQVGRSVYPFRLSRGRALFVYGPTFTCLQTAMLHFTCQCAPSEAIRTGHLQFPPALFHARPSGWLLPPVRLDDTLIVPWRRTGLGREPTRAPPRTRSMGKTGYRIGRDCQTLRCGTAQVDAPVARFGDGFWSVSRP